MNYKPLRRARAGCGAGPWVIPGDTRKPQKIRKEAPKKTPPYLN